MAINSKKLPSEKGYLMPAEWEEHSATQLHWPSNCETWPDDRLRRVEKVYLDIITVLSGFEPVVLLVDPSTGLKKVEEKILNRIPDLSNIHLFEVPVNDVWARDCGPIFIKNGNAGQERYAITDWDYNAWGGKYPPYDSDNRLPEWFSKTFRLKRFTPGMVLEGGSIDTNGEGTILTTESVLLNPNRNPDLSRKEIEERLKGFLGAKQIIWLKDGLKGDDTDGHIDDLSRFLDSNTILTMLCEDEEDVNYKALQENYQILREAKDLSGKPFRIKTLPLPKTEIEGTTVDGSEYVPASYANFYIANGVVLVPLYDKDYDHMALDLFKASFKDRDVVGIPCADLVWGQGSIHCITQQLYGLKF